jgi:phosphoribosylformimino-5-aminoimidazole carboxamide ribotide isomerase
MDIIPVLDLRGGIVVRARMGQRDQYRPLQSPLSPTSDPIDVMRGLRSVYPFKTFYIADLDAIMGTANNEVTLRQLKAEFPGAAFWVDNGVAELSAALSWLDTGPGHLVVGSESQRDTALMRRLSAHGRVVLSLDFREQAFQGPPALLDDVEFWPRRLIVMTLARVGSGAGPDLDRLRAVRDVAAGRSIYAAGGVRSRADLAALRREGIAGALVATSLHDGRLHGDDLAFFSGKDVDGPRIKSGGDKPGHDSE